MTSSNRARSRAIRARMAATGEPYTVAARAATHTHTDHPTPTAAPAAVDGGPRLPDTWTPVDDVNPICGHHRRANCVGCGSCTTCDACYCREDDFGGWGGGSLADEHANDVDGIHYGTYIDDCYACELERVRSDSFIRCADCDRSITGGRREWKRHQPCAWRTRAAGRPKPDQPHPPGIDWTVLWGRRVTFNDRWLYHGDMARQAGEWTGVIVPGFLAGDTHLPMLRLTTDDGQTHDMGNVRHWTIEIHQEHGREPFTPTPGPRLLGHLTSVRVDLDHQPADRAVHLVADDPDGQPIPGGPVLMPDSPTRRRTYRVLRTPDGWHIYQRAGWSQMPWIRSGILRDVTGPDATWWTLTPGLEYRLTTTSDGRWAVHALPETPCELPDPTTREDCCWPALGAITRADGYTRAICSRQRHTDVLRYHPHTDGPLPGDPAGPWT
ncbi:hypothetical protein Vqi01_34840 [Micromonospora qiuiae]|uniref:Uncharacterized protein n=1 Tax=Micromonospora qiuiae TaxID=502268 RepID=A0ABQ4JE13_9ACTN|nr:hypothetical protein [Micromonospora qiuiae]GIJ28322.1 hypothetical protein Vqi01_34840 [Micromonospora qiuiae]